MLALADVQPAAGYDDRWVLLAGAALAAVAAYYVVVWWATRPRRARRPRRPRRPATSREQCLSELDAIEAEVTQGRLSPREGHQQVSRAVRGFVGEAVEIPATRMTLAGLRDEGPAELADFVAVLYPPEFVAGDDRAARELPGVLRQARALVTTWR